MFGAPTQGGPEQPLALPNRSILMKLDRFRRTLVHAGPALNTILRAGRVGSLFSDFIDLAGTDLDTVSTTVAFFSVDDGIHMKISSFKLQISNCFDALRYALCAMRCLWLTDLLCSTGQYLPRLTSASIDGDALAFLAVS